MTSSAAAADGDASIAAADVQAEVTLDLFEAATGTAKVIHFHRHERCETCKGSGAKPGSRVETCRYCGGRGRVVQSTGVFSIQTTCPSCHGEGRVVREACGDCRGSGYVPKRVTRKVDIPAGIEDGSRLRLGGEGEPSPDGGPPGDCYCLIRLREHALFQREGRHLLCQVPITYTQAALGAKIDVPSLEGRETVEIGPGTQSGDVFTLRGKGMPDALRATAATCMCRCISKCPRNSRRRTKRCSASWPKSKTSTFRPSERVLSRR